MCVRFRRKRRRHKKSYSGSIWRTPARQIRLLHSRARTRNSTEARTKQGERTEDEQRRTPVFWQKAQVEKRLPQGTFQPVAQRVPTPPVFFYFQAMSGGCKPRAETFHWQNFLFFAESFRPNKTSESLRMSYTKIDLARRSSEDTPLLLLTPLHP